MKIPPKLPLLLVILLIQVKSYSITIYEISYEFKGNIDYPRYSALLIRYGDGTGFMRVRYAKYDNSETFLVNMDFDEMEGRTIVDNVEYQTLEIRGKNPVYIMNSSSNPTRTYTPDIFWFKKFRFSIDFEPWKVTSPGQYGDEEGNFTSQLINSADLTKEKVGEYFFTNEPFYANLFSSPNPVSSAGITIHLILVAATSDTSIGASVEKDMNNFYSEVNKVTDALNARLSYKLISGANFGKMNVENALSDLKPGPNDIVIFYYSGHGYTFDDMPDQPYPQLSLKRPGSNDNGASATINAYDIYSIIKNKNARLNLILADCCNSFYGLPKPKRESFARTAASSLALNKTFCDKLFVQSHGSIIAAAAKKGQFAFGNSEIGGFFTSNLTTAMEKYLGFTYSATPSWNDIFSETSATTYRLSEAHSAECWADKKLPEKDKLVSGCVQAPIYYIDTNQ